MFMGYMGVYVIALRSLNYSAIDVLGMAAENMNMQHFDPWQGNIKVQIHP